MKVYFSMMLTDYKVLNNCVSPSHHDLLLSPSQIVLVLLHPKSIGFLPKMIAGNFSGPKWEFLWPRRTRLFPFWPTLQPIGGCSPCSSTNLKLKKVKILPENIEIYLESNFLNVIGYSNLQTININVKT